MAYLPSRYNAYTHMTDQLWPHITISQEQEIITGLFHFQPDLTSYG